MTFSGRPSENRVYAARGARKPGEYVTPTLNVYENQGDVIQRFGLISWSLDLEGDLEEIRAVLEKAFHDWITLITRHFDCGDNRRTKSFAGLVVTTIEGAYVRCRPDRTSGPFKEAGTWLSELAKDQE